MKATLFGLQNSNRDFTQTKYWGKNYFTNSFPVALTCYMGQRKIPPVYLRLDKNLRIEHSTISVGDLFGNPQNSFFAFEADYAPYRTLMSDQLPPADLVIQQLNKNNACLRHFEIKLTALPDNSTCQRKESEYGCELVIRAQSIVYLALTIAECYQKDRKKLCSIIEPVCKTIGDWSVMPTIMVKIDDMIKALDQICLDLEKKQKPLLLNPVWRTEGKKPILHENCFDVFVWSNLAFTRLFVDRAAKERNGISRPARAVAWLIRMLWDFASRGRMDYAATLSEMTYENQTDKAFSMNGSQTLPFMQSEELSSPRIRRDEVKNIILNGGQTLLSPERRLDMVLYYSTDLF